ncbi:MAG: hypothetical protein A3H98_08435 [Bacteroidetes bacterium RIFCSPLOWO2_02_FULL_36_8]|nr:MAG: hypothetical protein A3H98_08435 [Bacteroidetes bacterium RIFCSPLOWO2_02_FULL_36_8]OFY71385.1 MAG: hypothetical protein A3G23_04325 [Bacteroidetes bacterium RIFCSPLOWO2_12_FULL_37_12]
MIDIKLLNKKLLIEFINHSNYNTLDIVPITEHRALSQIQNPRLHENDILLLLAYKEKELVGYLGVLPDKINFNNKFEKCGWLSCLWVKPEQRGFQIAKLLLDKCFEVWENRILATEFTKNAKKLYDKTNFFSDLKIIYGIRLYIRSDLHTLLPPKKRLYKKLIFFLKTADALINFLFDLRFFFWKFKIYNATIEYMNLLDNEVEEFISVKLRHQLFKRGITELNWIINNPWILATPDKDIKNNKYYFSSYDKSFNFYALKIRNSNKQLIAFMIFSKRNQILKLPYCYYEDGSLKTVVDVIYYHLLKWKINTFTTFNPDITLFLRNNRTPALFKRDIKRHYIISDVFRKIIFQDAFEFEIQDGDADCSFT